MATHDHSQEPFDVFVRLPSGPTAPLAVRYDMTIFELKSMIEFTFGVPVEMQNLSYKHRLLYHDDETLRTCIVIPGVRIAVDYPYGWEDLIEASLAGDTKSVINDIYHHFDKSIIARRRSVVLFISSHKGYSFIVERMLSDGVNPNTRTATGRTALHIAGAMGTMNCVGLLLQHHASVDIRDKFGFTPQKVAAICGQKEAEIKLIQFRHIKSKWDRKSARRQLPWPLATNFPKTKLGQSVTPMIDLQQLCISPGPEEIRLYPLPGQRPRSAVVRSAKTITSPRGAGVTHGDVIMQKNGEAVVHGTGGRLDKSSGHAFQKKGHRRPKSAFITTSDPSVALSCVRNEANPKERISLRGNKSHANRSLAEKEICQQTTLENQQVNVCCGGEFHSCDCVYDSSTEFVRTVLHESPVVLHPHGVNNPVRAQESTLTQESPLTHESSHYHESSSDHESSHDHESASTHESSHTHEPSSDHESSHAHESTRDHESSHTQESSNDHRSSHAHKSSRAFDTPHGRVSRTRHSLSVPVSSRTNVRPITISDLCLSGQTDEEKRIRKAVAPRFISEKERFHMKYGKKRATDEENEHAFQQWLALKQQDAKDEKLVKKVRKMLNEVIGIKMEEKKESSKDQSVRVSNEKAFDDWLMKKKKADTMRRRQESQLAKENERRKLVRQGKAFDEWVKEKNRTKSTVRGPLSEESKRMTSDTKRLEAQLAYTHWLMKKQWEELETLQASMRPQSAVSLAECTDDIGLPIRKARIQSGQPRLKIR